MQYKIGFSTIYMAEPLALSHEKRERAYGQLKRSCTRYAYVMVYTGIRVRVCYLSSGIRFV
jgi:hypothetical protein